jgi:hypothetical protein
MTINRWITLALWIIAVMMILNFAQRVAVTTPAQAVGETPGRYQITSWAAHGGGFLAHQGYYIVDTVTGKIVDQGSFPHTNPSE